MEIKKAVIEDIDTVTKLASELWNSHTYGELSEEYKAILLSEKDIVFFAFDGEKPAGFAHCSLRNDYVVGTSGGAVGYLEGIYIIPEYRKKGLAKTFVEYGEEWARKQGCKEFASDCELDNSGSYNFHIAVGFEEANRIICFKKKIK